MQRRTRLLALGAGAASMAESDAAAGPWAQLRNALGGNCLDDNGGNPFADAYACVDFGADDAVNENWRRTADGAGLECQASIGTVCCCC